MILNFNKIKNYYVEKFLEHILGWVKHNSPRICLEDYVILSFEDSEYHILDEIHVSEIMKIVERKFKYSDFLYAYSSRSAFIRKQINQFLNVHMDDWLRYVLKIEKYYES